MQAYTASADSALGHAPDAVLLPVRPLNVEGRLVAQTWLLQRVCVHSSERAKFAGEQALLLFGVLMLK